MANNNLFLDFVTNMNGSNNQKTIAFAPLEDQFSKLNIINKEQYGFMRDFLNMIFFENEQTDIHISSPSFNKIPRMTDHGHIYYNNIAIRVSISPEQDLVLMGDVMIRRRNVVNQSFFIVKTLTVMDSNIVHMGEFDFSSVVYISYDKNENVAEWENYDSSSVYLTDSDWSKSIFSEDFILELSKSYVVDKPNEVIKTIRDWEKYLDAKEYLRKKNSEKGFHIETPVFIKGYVKELKKGQNESLNSDDIIHQRDDRIWSLTNISGSDERILCHVIHSVYEKEFNIDEKNYLKKFNGLTKSSVKIIDPSKKDEKKADSNTVFKFDDSRIAVAKKDLIPPKNELDELNDRESLEAEKAKINSDKKFHKMIDAKISEFKNKELITLIDAFKKEQKGPVTLRVTADRLNKIESDWKIAQDSVISAEKKSDEAIKTARKKHSKLKDDDLQKAVMNERSVLNANENLLNERKKLDKHQIESKYDLLEMVINEISRLAQSEEEILIKNKRNELTQLLKPQFDEELRQELSSIKEEYDYLRKEAEIEGNIIQLHTYFEVFVDESSNPDLTLKEANNSLKGHSEYFLTYDDSGDRILLERQKSALEKFKNGYVMNPFLATALFCPKAGERVSDIPIETFYQDTLNSIQKKAVEAAVSSNGIFLIQGPPGTGKTQVIAEITTQLALQGKKVLISSENNKAVDNAFSRLPKNPIIRPLRLVNDKKSQDNPYSIQYLLENFYDNISKTLDERINKYENFEHYRDNFKEKFDELTLQFDKLKRMESDLKDIENDIKKKQSQLNELDQDLSEKRTKNNEIESKIDELNDALTQISNFKFSNADNEVNDPTDEERQFMEKLLSILKSGGIILQDDATASKIAGDICNMDDLSINSQISKMKIHKEYFDLHLKKSVEKSPKEITELNKKIAEYEDLNTLSKSDFPLFELFNVSSLTTDSVLKLKTKLDNLRKNERQTIQESLAGLKELVNDTSSLERQRRNLDEEITELKEDEAYASYDSSRDKLHSAVRKVYSELRISDSYRDLTEALQILEGNWSSLSKNFIKSKEKNKKLIPVYRDISKYLTDEDILKNDKDQYTKSLESYVNVIGMTSTAKSFIRDTDIDVNRMGIDVVIVDEVSKISFVELLQPILYGKTVILVGDHKQLPPMYTSCVPYDADWSDYEEEYITKELDEQFKKNYEDSFFKTLFLKTPESSKVMLNVQYRMHPQIMEVDNEFYFDAPLEFGGKDKDHYLSIGGSLRNKIISPDNHVIFIDCKGKERQESGSTSFVNESEADVVVRILDLINENCKFDRNHQPIKEQSQYRKTDSRLSVGVICTYADQARFIRNKRRKSQKYLSFNNDEDEKFMVKTVDDFQGDERDIIILSMVRTNSRAKFLQEYRRINVAMSRARRLLIIVGNDSVLSGLSVEIDSVGHDSKKKKVYAEIIRKIKQYNGYRSIEDVMGGN